MRRNLGMMTCQFYLLMMCAGDMAWSDSVSHLANTVVKVNSGFCSEGKARFSGSGVLVSVGGRQLVLTSDHVVLHGSAPDYCHTVSSPQLATVQARLVAADWGYGLALLELDSESASIKLRFAKISGKAAQVDSGVLTVGYPWASSGAIVSAGGRVLSANSRRHWIAQLPSALELIDAHGEFGMSGGAVFSSDGKRLLGLLSHQYLEMVPGQPTHVETYGQANNQVQNHVIAIPAQTISAWIKMVLARGYTPAFALDPLSQLRGENVVYAAGFRFSLHELSSEVATEIGGGDGGGIGGGDGGGIGGGDGGGIGGGDGGGIGGGDGGGIGGLSVRGRNVVRVALDRDPDSHPSKWIFGDRKGWLDSMRVALERNAGVQVFFFGNSVVGLGVREEIESLAGFFVQLASPALVPVTILTRSRSERERIAGREREARAVRAVAIRMLTAIPSSNDSIGSRMLLRNIEELALVLQSEAWSLAGTRELERLSDVDGHTGWTWLFDHYFDEGTELLRHLKRLSLELGKVGIYPTSLFSE